MWSESTSQSSIFQVYQYPYNWCLLAAEECGYKLIPCRVNVAEHTIYGEIVIFHIWQYTTLVPNLWLLHEYVF